MHQSPHQWQHSQLHSFGELMSVFAATPPQLQFWLACSACAQLSSLRSAACSILDQISLFTVGTIIAGQLVGLLLAFLLFCKFAWPNSAVASVPVHTHSCIPGRGKISFARSTTAVVALVRMHCLCTALKSALCCLQQLKRPNFFAHRGNDHCGTVGWSLLASLLFCKFAWPNSAVASVPVHTHSCILGWRKISFTCSTTAITALVSMLCLCTALKSALHRLQQLKRPNFFAHRGNDHCGTVGWSLLASLLFCKLFFSPSFFEKRPFAMFAKSSLTFPRPVGYVPCKFLSCAYRLTHSFVK